MPLKNFKPGKITFEACGSWNSGSYLLDKESAYALEMALVTKRPLLVKGEPGLGKSYLARAAAQQLGRAFLSEVVNINTEGQDLLWRDDPIARLNDAQFKQADKDALGIQHYISPSVLWWAFDWDDALKQCQPTNCYNPIYKPQIIDDKKREKGIVLLIDEIDKADPSLPNSLLEVLGNGGFEIPILDKTIGKNNKQDDKQEEKTYKEPLVIITTNNERELPPAFERRCLVLHLKVDEENIEEWLIERADVHIADANVSNKVKKIAAEQLKKERAQAKEQGLIKAGLAEYLDLLNALQEMTQDLEGDREAREQAQITLLDEIADFALKKADYEH